MPPIFDSPVAKDIATFKTRQEEVNAAALAATTASADSAQAVAECIREQDEVAVSLREQRGRK